MSLQDIYIILLKVCFISRTNLVFRPYSLYYRCHYTMVQEIGQQFLLKPLYLLRVVVLKFSLSDSPLKM